MAQPALYTRQQNFVNWQTANPGVDFEGTDLDAEFNTVKTSVNRAIANLALIQRDDGELANGAVGTDQLSAAVGALFAATGCTLRGAWSTTVDYALKDVVTRSGSTYVCAVAHTSGTFATDLAAAYWILISAANPTATNGAQVFSGDASTTVFTLSGSVGTPEDILVFVAGSYQRPTGTSPAYTVSGTTLTFASAPASGTRNIVVLSVATIALGATLLALQGLTTTAYGRALLTAASLSGLLNNMGVNAVLHAPLAATTLNTFRGLIGIAGAKHLLEEYTAALDASHDFTIGFSTAFDSYELELINISTDISSYLELQFSTDGGLSYDSGANYKRGGISKWTEGVGEIANATGVNAAPITIDMADAAAYGNAGDVRITSRGAIGLQNVHTFVRSEMTRTDAGNDVAILLMHSVYVGAAGSRINAIRLKPSDPTAKILSGTVRLRGIYNS